MARKVLLMSFSNTNACTQNKLGQAQFVKYIKTNASAIGARSRILQLTTTHGLFCLLSGREPDVDDFRVLLEQNGAPFWLPIDGNRDLSLVPYSPNDYPVTTQLVWDSVRSSYRAPEGNTGRQQLAIRNTEIKLDYYSDAEHKVFSNGFVLGHFVEPEWKSSISKANTNKEFEEMIALAAPDEESAVHLYLRVDKPTTQEEDLRPVKRHDGEQVFWMITRESVTSRLRKYKNLGVESVGKRGKPIESNGFRLFWIKQKS